MNRIIAKIRTDDKLKKMPVHEAYEYNLGNRKCFVTFYLDPMDQCGDIMIKLEDDNGNAIDAINIFIPQEPNDHFTVEHDKNYIFAGSKEQRKLIKEKNK